MSSKSKIEWTDATWNPVRGCTLISPGCAHCYAQTFAERFRGVPGHPYEQGFDLRLVPEKLTEPLTWTKPQMVFVNSMSDLFHKDVPDEYIVLVAQVMAAANWHTYQVLTKRSERMRDLLRSKLAFAAKLNHIWWGVSVENRKHGLPRIDYLREAAPAMTFTSVEPLLEDLGQINLAGIDWADGQIRESESSLLIGCAPALNLTIVVRQENFETWQRPFIFLDRTNDATGVGLGTHHRASHDNHQDKSCHRYSGKHCCTPGPSSLASPSTSPDRRPCHASIPRDHRPSPTASASHPTAAEASH